MTSPSQDPRLLDSITQAKAADVEARLIAHIASHPAAPPALVYTQVPGSVTQTANGNYTWTCPAGVTSAKVECVGAGAGAGGGSAAEGGEGGGGGEYACEPAYPVVPGQVYAYVVGNGGTGGTTGYAGQGGSDTIFDTASIGLPSGVFANGGNAGANYTGGAGGGAGGAGNTPSPNTIAHAGGSGGGANNQGTGGCGGGGGGGAATGGTGGSTSGSSAGAPGGAGNYPGGNGGAGGNSAANGATAVQSGGGGGGAGASTSATTGSNSYRFSYGYTYFGSDATGGNANQLRSTSGSMYQGGETASGGSYNGTMKSLGLISGNPQADLAGKTIDSVSIRLEWVHTWYASGAYIILGYINFTTFGNVWNGLGSTAVKTWFQGNVGNPVWTDLTNLGLGSALQSGAAKSLTFGPGTPGFNLYNYGYLYGAGASNADNPLLTVNWHTGTAPVQAGAGCDGKVTITYAIGGVLQSALQPAAGTDANLNAFAAGYTGALSAVQPASSPSAVETWHSVSPPSPLTGTIRYRYRGDAHVEIKFDLTVPSGAASGTLTLFTLPSGYLPATQFRGPAPGYFTNGQTTVAQLVSLLNMRFQVTAAGAVQVLAFPGGASGTGITECDGSYLVPLD